jgi:hypothetical protein
MLKKLLRNRKGTAEVIGSVMFIVILLFFFTNVYLWHDAATKQMNDFYVNKMNAGMTLNLTSTPYSVTAQGSNVIISRVWIITNGGQHLYANLESDNVHLLAGKETKIAFTATTEYEGNSLKADWNSNINTITIHYNPTDSINKISVLNTLGVLV